MVCSVTRSRYAFAHFCCYLQYLVHVTSLPCRRNTRSRHFLQKNTMVSTQNAFQDCPKALETQIGSERLLTASWGPPEGLLKASRELPESLFEYLGRYFDQIWAKSHFFQNGHVSKFQECHFSRKKSPCGRLPNIEELFRSPHRTFQNLPPQNKFIFLITWKSDSFQKMVWLMEIYRSKSIFYWKPKWSVWSIWTYSTGWILKFVT